MLNELRDYLPNTFFRWVILLISVGVVFRLVRYGVRMPLWGDEAMLGVNFLDRGPENLFAPLEYGQVLPAGYLMLTWVCTQFLGYSEMILRLPAVLCSIGSLLVMYWFASRRFSRVQTVCIVGLLAVSYYVVRHGAEFKPYAADALVSLILIITTVRVYSQAPSLAWRLTFIVLIILAPLFSFPSVFVAVSSLITLAGSAIASKDRGRFRLVIVAAVSGLLTFTIYYYSYITPHGNANPVLFSYWQDSFPPANALEFPLWLIKQLAGNMLAYPIPSSKFGAITMVTCLIGAWRLLRSGDRFLLWIIILPFLFTLVASMLHLYPFGGSARIAQHLVPSVMILAGVGLAWMISPQSNGEVLTRTQVIVFSILCLLGIAGVVQTLIKPYKSKGAFEARKLVEDLVDKDHCLPIHVFNDIDQVPINFRWYLGINERSILGYDAKIHEVNEGTVCLILFDGPRYPIAQQSFEQALVDSSPGQIESRQGTAYLYREEEHPHTYSIAIIRRP